MRQSIRKLNLSVPSDVHVMLSIYAKTHEKTLSQAIEELVKKYLTPLSSPPNWKANKKDEEIHALYEDGAKEYKEGKAKKIDSLKKEYEEMKRAACI